MTPAALAAPDAARQRALLDERARLLARPAAVEHRGAKLSLVTFEIGAEHYGIESHRVWGVFRLNDLAPLPGAEPSVAGLTSWRGDLLAVLDLRVLLGLPAAGLDDRAWVVCIGDTRPVLGLLAGAMQDLVTVPADEIRGPRTRDPRPLVRGVTRDAVLVVDVEILLKA
ncbi:MAG TPA: chemotaxis protein CheW [Gemmatimonadales bacterium]